MDVPILLHHLLSASGIVVRVQTEVEFLHSVPRSNQSTFDFEDVQECHWGSDTRHLGRCLASLGTLWQISGGGASSKICHLRSSSQSTTFLRGCVGESNGGKKKTGTSPQERRQIEDISGEHHHFLIFVSVRFCQTQ